MRLRVPLRELLFGGLLTGITDSDTTGHSVAERRALPPVLRAEYAVSGDDLDIRTAVYFEDRAKRSRSEADRARFLAAARKYRELAAKKNGEAFKDAQSDE
jgi:hypothetical protein